jgi:hypothetical protein
VKARGGGRRGEEGIGAGFYFYFTAKVVKSAKDFVTLTLRPSAVQYFINTI